jgi:HAD superfamily phosphatase (TIGR01668 family)
MKIRPDYTTNGAMDLTVEFLKSHGIKLLLCDLDNTLAPYGGKPPSDALKAWRKRLTRAGIGVFIVSNTKRPRVDLFAKQFGVDFVKHAKKPFRPSKASIERIMARFGATPKTTAFVGDQLFTDILAANNCKLTSILVRPISLNNPLYFLRYCAEWPFRRSAIRRQQLREFAERIPINN